jgi:hypothetical protein
MNSYVPHGGRISRVVESWDFIDKTDVPIKKILAI